MRKLYMFLAPLLLLSSLALAGMMDWNGNMMGWGSGMMGGWWWPFGIGWGIFGVFVFIIWILALVFWIWMLVDAVTRKFDDNIEKLIWVVVIVFLNIIGALVYYFVVKAREGRSVRPHLRRAGQEK